MKISININGENAIWEIDSGGFLYDVLRNNGYFSVKKGCDAGSCGLCTVWVDEVPVLSCSFLAARADGKKITTIDGVKKDAEKFVNFLVAEGAEQCGFCSPGFVMTVLAMERELGNPTEDEINHYLAGNLCRCTGYEGQLRAVIKYLRRNCDEIR